MGRSGTPMSLQSMRVRLVRGALCHLRPRGGLLTTMGRGTITRAELGRAGPRRATPLARGSTTLIGRIRRPLRLARNAFQTSLDRTDCPSFGRLRQGKDPDMERLRGWTAETGWALL
jgi:hypothetical protein